MTFEEVCSVFHAEGHGNSRKCKCPAHDDKKDSLSISRGSSGKTLIHCHAGCDIEGVLEAVGLKLSDLTETHSAAEDFSDTKWRSYVESSMSRKTGKQLKIEAVYDYLDIPSGAYAYTKIRMTGKEMVYGIVADGRFNWGLNNRAKGLYTRSVKELREAASRGERIYYAEGEKDVITLQNHGYLAVTAGGSSDWRSNFSDLFRGADVVILADNDEPGLKLAKNVERDLTGKAAAVTVIIPTPELDKGDITDFFEAGNTDQDFQQLIESVTNTFPDGVFNIADLIGENLKPKKPEIISGILRKGHIMLISGASKIGKSFLSIELAAAIASGGKWMGRNCTKGKVLYLNFELDSISVAHRFENVITSCNAEIGRNIQIYQLRGKHSTAQTVCSEVSRICEKWVPDMIIVDPIYRLIEGDENSATDVAKLFAFMDELSQKHGSAVIMIHHHSKGGQAGKAAMDRSSGSGVFARSPDAILDILELELSQIDQDRIKNEYKESVEGCTAFRAEMTLREFKTPDPVTGWFKYPIHWIDDQGILRNARSAAEARAVDAKRAANKQSVRAWKDDIETAFKKAICDNSIRDGDKVDPGLLADDLGCSIGTLKNHLQESGFRMRKGMIEKKSSPIKK